jgi:sulfur carrier protein ThiS
MRIAVESRDFKKSVQFKGKTVGQLMRGLKLSPENFVISKSGGVVLEDEILSDGDKIRLFPVISGG